SSVWIDYFNGHSSPETDRLDALLDTQLLATGDLMLTEVLQGFRTDKGFEEAKRLLTSLEIIELGGREVALQAATNYRQLRTLGVTVGKTIDTIIATRCIIDGHSLLFADRDFHPFVKHLGMQSALRS
ncbi:MAG: PIN domain nuclease, partial [Gemmatimonadaceae bacterium]